MAATTFSSCANAGIMMAPPINSTTVMTALARWRHMPTKSLGSVLSRNIRFTAPKDGRTAGPRVVILLPRDHITAVLALAKFTAATL